MGKVWFRFYEELNEFLPAAKNKTLIPYDFSGKVTVKSAIEEIGVPHVEVDLILINGHSVGFSSTLLDGDMISVYPVFESLDITGVTHLREKPLREPRFILDAHLGRLSKYLRLCGFDAIFDPGISDKEIVSISVESGRIILTRDRNLLKNKKITRGYWIRSGDPHEQLKEVVGRLDLANAMDPFVRCSECNTLLDEITRDEISGILEEKTRKYYNDFKICRSCNRIYWEGSHFKRMKLFIEGIKNGSKSHSL